MHLDSIVKTASSRFRQPSHAGRLKECECQVNVRKQEIDFDILRRLLIWLKAFCHNVMMMLTR